MADYLAVIEPLEGCFSAYFPDLPGCAATGSTREELEENIRIALQRHMEGLIADNQPIPESRAFAEFIMVIPSHT
jgi:predicted RNase H-like HicB family nuclease